MEFAKILLVAQVLSGTTSFTVFGHPEGIGKVGAARDVSNSIGRTTAAAQGGSQIVQAHLGRDGLQISSQASQVGIYIRGPEFALAILLAPFVVFPNLSGSPLTGIITPNLPNPLAILAKLPQLGISAANPVNLNSEIPAGSDIQLGSSALTQTIYDLTPSAQGRNILQGPAEIQEVSVKA